jgi:hypothetical protein
MAGNARSAYRVIRPLTEEERDRVLKEFVRLQGQEKPATSDGS